MLAKQRKQFTKGEFIKSCLTATSEETCPEKINLTTLLATTIAWKANNSGNHINSQLKKNKADYFEWFSLALDGSTHITDVIQVLSFLWGEESSGTSGIVCGTSTDENISKRLGKNCKTTEVESAKMCWQLMIVKICVEHKKFYLDKCTKLMKLLGV